MFSNKIGINKHLNYLTFKDPIYHVMEQILHIYIMNTFWNS